MTPGLFAEAEKALGPYPPSHLWNVDQDERRAAFNIYLIATRKPRLHLAYLAGLDEASHASGPGSPAAAAALARIDSMVGRIRAAAEANGPAIVAVTSDHGFRRTRRELHLNAALREAGLIHLGRDGGIDSWRAFAWGMGGSVSILLRDPGDHAARATVSRLLAQLEADPRAGITRVLRGGEVAASGGIRGGRVRGGSARRAPLRRRPVRAHGARRRALGHARQPARRPRHGRGVLRGGPGHPGRADGSGASTCATSLPPWPPAWISLFRPRRVGTSCAEKGGPAWRPPRTRPSSGL